MFYTKKERVVKKKVKETDFMRTQAYSCIGAECASAVRSGTQMFNLD